MGRFWFGICLLAALLGLGLWTASAMDSLHGPVSDTLQEAARQTLAGDMDAGIHLAQQAQKAWQDHWNSAASVSDHSPMDEIDGLFAQMQVYAKAGEATEFAAHCARLSQLVEAVGEAQRLTLWNLL